jgi:hypothetical protein
MLHTRFGFDYDQSVMASTAPASPTKLKQAVAPPAPITDVDEGIKSAPEHSQIANLAYGYWLDRQHSGEGSPDDDWLRAERELGGNPAVR